MRERYENLITKHPVLVLLVGVVVTAAFAYLIPQLKFSSSAENFFIKGDPDREFFVKAKELFGNDQVVVVALIVPEGKSVYTKDALAQLASLTRDLGAVEGVDAAASLSNVPSIMAPRDPVTGEYLKKLAVEKLVPRVPETDAEWDRLRQKIAFNPLYTGNLISSDERALAVILFIHDYDRETQRYKQVMADVRAAMAANESGPGRAYLAGVPETRVQIEQRMVADLKLLLPITFGVIIVILIISFRQARGVLLPLATIVATTLWTVGFMQAVGIPITMVTIILPPLMVALGSSYSIHLMSEYAEGVTETASVREIVKTSIGHVSAPVLACGLTTIIGFASLIINPIPAIQDLGKAAVVGIVFAIVIALFMMPASLMLMKKPTKINKPGSAPYLIDRVLDRLATFNLRVPYLIFAVAAVLALVSLVGISRLEIDTDFLSFFSEKSRVVMDVRAQTDHLAGAAPFNIVIESDRGEAFKHPAILKRMEELQRWALAEVPGIDTTLSLVDFIKVLNQAIHQNDPAYYVIPDDPKEVSLLLLIYATTSSPEDLASYVTSDFSAANVMIRSRLVGSTETNQAIKRIEAYARELFEAPPRSRERPTRGADKPQTPLPLSVLNESRTSRSSLLSPEETIIWLDDDWGLSSGDSVAGARIPAEQPEAFDAGESAPTPAPAVDARGLPMPTEEAFPWPGLSVRVTGTIYLVNKSADAVSRGQVTGLATALVAIFLIMSVMFLSPRIGLLAMLPNLFPIFILFGLMGFSGITLNFSTSLIAAIALGIGVDDTIHYVNRYNLDVNQTRDQAAAMRLALTAMGKPMIYTSVALFFGFIILAFSDFVPIRQFGFLTAVIIMVALASNLVILPTLTVSVRIITFWDLISLEIGARPSEYIRIFNGLTNHQAKVAVLMGHTVDYGPGERVFAQGDRGEDMYVVLKGVVDIVIAGKDDEQTVIAKIQDGGAFGEMALLSDDSVRSASARADGRVKLFVVNEKALTRLERRYPRISSRVYHNVSEILSERLLAADKKLYSSE